VELAGISRTRDLARASDVVVIVLDGSAPLDELDANVLALASDAGSPRLFVRAKIDLSPQWAAHDLQRFEADRDASWEVHDVSAHTGRGVAILCAAIHEALRDGVTDSPLERPAIVVERHHVALLRAAERLANAQRVLDRAGELELVALELQSANLELEEIVGISAPDDVLERVFSKFCIGK
jgi:tRNA modification GTPase